MEITVCFKDNVPVRWPALSNHNSLRICGQTALPPTAWLNVVRRRLLLQPSNASAGSRQLKPPGEQATSFAAAAAAAAVPRLARPRVAGDAARGLHALRSTCLVREVAVARTGRSPPSPSRRWVPERCTSRMGKDCLCKRRKHRSCQYRKRRQALTKVHMAGASLAAKTSRGVGRPALPLHFPRAGCSGWHALALAEHAGDVATGHANPKERGESDVALGKARAAVRMAEKGGAQ